MLRISNIRLDLSSRLLPLLSTGEFKMEWVPISKYVSSNYIYVFLNYIYVWSNSWLGETVCKCRKTITTRGETRTQKTWDRSPSYMNVWWKLFNDWQQLQHGTRGYQINFHRIHWGRPLSDGWLYPTGKPIQLLLHSVTSNAYRAIIWILQQWSRQTS